MEQVINEAIAAKLESPGSRRQIIETVERFVAAPKFMNRLIEPIIDSKDFKQPVAAVIKHCFKISWSNMTLRTLRSA